MGFVFSFLRESMHASLGAGVGQRDSNRERIPSSLHSQPKPDVGLGFKTLRS